MRKRVSTLLIAVLALAAFGGTASVATAKHGADDPAGHIRQSRGADDPVGHVRHSGADDSKLRHARRGHGAHHGPNHR